MEQDRGLRLLGEGVQHGPVDRGAQRGQLLHGGPCCQSVACCHFDLHPGGEHPAPVVGGGTVHGLPEQGLGLVRPALGQAQERQPGLRRETGLLGVQVGGLGGVEVAPEPVDFALFVEAAVGGHMVAVEGEVLRGFGSVDRLGPGAVQPVQLGPVHLALAAEGHHVLLRVAPPVQRPRPLVGAAQVKGQMAGFDHCAVDDPGGDGGDFPDGDGDHGFVKQGQAAVELAQQDLCLPEAQRTEGRRVSVAACPSEVRRPG